MYTLYKINTFFLHRNHLNYIFLQVAKKMFIYTYLVTTTIKNHLSSIMSINRNAKLKKFNEEQNLIVLNF